MLEDLSPERMAKAAERGKKEAARKYMRTLSTFTFDRWVLRRTPMHPPPLRVPACTHEGWP